MGIIILVFVLIHEKCDSCRARKYRVGGSNTPKASCEAKIVSSSALKSGLCAPYVPRVLSIAGIV